MNNWIFDLKKEKNKKLKKEFWLTWTTLPLWLIKLQNKDLIRDLRDWLLSLKVWFIIEVDWVDNWIEKLWENIIAVSKINKWDLPWFDFVLLDECNVNIDDYIKNWVTPIVKCDCHLSPILKQFNPLKNEWNSFLYEDFNKWSIFAWIVKYTENFRFPFDNKNLVKNVINI
jgi:hypothetical protein